jgi:D-alanyl-D-alanine carboxypeptidase
MAIKNFLLSIFIAFVGTHATAQAPEFVSKTDSLLNYLHQNNRFCGSVMVSKGSNTLYQKDFKSSDDVKVKESFRIGSVTKLFTAVIIYQLIEENKLSLQTKLSVFFPTIKNSKNITIKHLLGHQSGIRDILSDDNFEKIRTKTSDSRKSSKNNKQL